MKSGADVLSSFKIHGSFCAGGEARGISGLSKKAYLQQDSFFWKEKQVRLEIHLPIPEKRSGRFAEIRKFLKPFHDHLKIQVPKFEWITHPKFLVLLQQVVTKDYEIILRFMPFGPSEVFFFSLGEFKEDKLMACVTFHFSNSILFQNKSEPLTCDLTRLAKPLSIYFLRTDQDQKRKRVSTFDIEKLSSEDSHRKGKRVCTFDKEKLSSEEDSLKIITHQDGRSAERCVRLWMERVTGIFFSKPFREQIWDGEYLLILLTKIKSDILLKYETDMGAPASLWQPHMRLDVFLSILQTHFGLSVLFQTSDLLVDTDSATTYPNVIRCIFEFSDVVYRIRPDLPILERRCGVPELIMSNLDDQFCRAVLRENGMALEYFPSDLKKNRDIILEAVRGNGYAIQYIETMIFDKEIVLAAVTQNGLVLKYLHPILKLNKGVCLHAVKSNGLAFKYVAPKLQSDYDLCLTAVKANGLSLQFATNHLKGNRYIVQAAVRENGLALEFCADHLKADRDIVLAAVQSNQKAFFFASSSVKSHHDILTTLTASSLSPCPAHQLPQYQYADSTAAYRQQLHKEETQQKEKQ